RAARPGKTLQTHQEPASRLLRPATVARCAAAALWLMVTAETAAAQMALPGAFKVSPTGAATYSIPIAVPPGTAGMAPTLSLDYSSQAGNGLVGLGWSLAGLPAITRCPRTLRQDGIHGTVNNDTDDRFCLDGQRLVVFNGGVYGGDGTEYRTEIDSYARIT